MSLAAARRELRDVPLGLIDEPALPSRSTMDEEKLAALVASMRAIGFVSVLVLARRGDRFEVIAGHRRTLAARQAGLVVVPALVYESSEAALESIQHAENKLREDLSPTDEAIWFAELLEKYPDDGTDGVAARTGEKRSYVEGRLALLTGCQRVFRALEAGQISIGVAQQLNRIDQELHRVNLLDQAVRNGCTVATVSGWVLEYQQIHKAVVDSVVAGQADATTAPVPLNDYFRCLLCEGKHNPQNMRPIQMHDYCVEAVLRPALEAQRTRGAVLTMPRTADEARELINELADRFPAVLAGAEG